MNDFTKDELQDILNCVAFTCFEHPTEDERLTDIRIKLESMIGNYCDHKIYEIYFIGDNRHYHCSECQINLCEVGIKDDNQQSE